MQPTSFLAVRVAGALLLCTCPTSAQVPIDLTSWTQESYDAVSGFGAGVWTVSGGGTSVQQSVNGQPTLFYSPFDAFNTQAEGEIVAELGDDDFIGFVLGFDPGDSTNPNADYLLVDWKSGTQAFNFGAPSCTGGSTAQAGLAVSRVVGVPTADEFWGHVDLDGSCSGPESKVTELARATNLGSTGWAADQTYSFRFELTATQLRVFVDGSLEIEIAGLFSNGRFGFYNFSQANVTYSAYTVNCGANWSNVGSGLAGTLGVPGLALADLPSFGTSTTVDLTSSNPSPSTAIVLYGPTPAIVPTDLGGVLWLLPTGAVIQSLAPGTTQIPLDVGLNPALCTTAVYAQFVQDDPGAPFGFAFSPAIEIVFGF